MDQFELKTSLTPKGDQPIAIKKLVEGIKHKQRYQVLLGATGTGKTFTMANVIAQTNLNTIVIVHNKTLANQLYGEFKSLFPNNNVEYYVSYFDYYQPEAYIPKTGTYIEKAVLTNKEIEMMRLSTINSLASGKKTIVVASVASIYASVSKEDFNRFRCVIKRGQELSMVKFRQQLVKLQYQNKIDALPGTFSFKGGTIDIILGYTDQYIIRIIFDGDIVESIATIDPIDKKIIEKKDIVEIVCASEYVMDQQRWQQAVKRIKQELKERIHYFKQNNKLIEAQRIESITNNDIESLQELGYCSGIENYSMHLELRQPGSTPYNIIDYFRDQDWLLLIDESHMTIPQIKGMYETDKSRKTTLVEYGFRLPSALDNRPLRFEEFMSYIKYLICVSATPNEWELNQSNGLVVEQIVRPTGLVDPQIEVVPTKDQINHICQLLNEQVKKSERTFITVLSIKMAESLTQHLRDKGFKVMYLHNELKTLVRMKVINDLRKGKYDAIVGINLIREGLDVPEVSLVAIFDADKPGFFRSPKALIQTFGRAARNIHGRVVLYADQVSEAMKIAIDETNRRRKIQTEYNKVNKIKPKTISKPITFDISDNIDPEIIDNYLHDRHQPHTKLDKLIKMLKKKMLEAANNQEYERAADIRDLIISLKK